MDELLLLVSEVKPKAAARVSEAPHTLSVVATLAQGVFQPGDARALSFATASFGGMSFTGVADEPLQLVR